MKTKRIENHITYFILISAFMILNFKQLSFISFFLGSIIILFIILFLEKINIYKY